MPTARDRREQDLRIELMQQDLKLKRRQTFWENPRNLVVVIGGVIAATAALVGTVAGLAGYKLGSQPAQTIIVLPPGTTITTPPAR
jgi:uncharacterized membrane protein